ncbi:2Fe-2S iron-sulfur cluster-binding protein [Larkinella knui]|uniref:2Fe-2S iron-sulfur cluster-binding protein n=1 Tax=Larkinella knui TaxID=2025310 RepID=UPI0035B5C327
MNFSGPATKPEPVAIEPSSLQQSARSQTLSGVPFHCRSGSACSICATAHRLLPTP